MNNNPTLTPLSLPVIPVRDKIVFPHLASALVIGRPRSIQAVNRAFRGDRLAFVVHQRRAKVEEPGRNDLFEYGSIVEIMDTLRLPQDLMRVRVVGRQRAKLLDMSLVEGALVGDIQPIVPEPAEQEPPKKIEALRRVVLRKFEEYAKKIGRIPLETVKQAGKLTSLDHVADLISDALLVSIEEKQDLIEISSIAKRLSRLVELLNIEIEILDLEQKIQTRVDRQVQKNHKEYYLNEQLRAIQKELKKKDDGGKDADGFRAKVKALKMEPETEENILKEVDRLEKMMPYSPEATVVRTYLEWVTELPWNTRSKEIIDVKKAKTILDADHFGLDKPKERLLEYMAVLKLTKSIGGPILCFSGPPGVGKTSLAKSLGRAMNRKFYRISLGGVRDEAEIRGHRRTYIGSLPGRIIQALRKTKTKNPVILLDEIDKMGSDWRGDPGAALLEVLDPEQNKSFNDHYIDADFDLSEVIFIATANSLYGIPSTLLDRMEVIRFSAYTTEEKVSIARKYLLPKTLKEHGLKSKDVELSDDVLRKVIHIYTQEAGVRHLQRKLAQICRKVAVEVVQQESKQRAIKISLKDLTHYLGAPDFVREKITVNAVGIATGLAWTEHGGETLTIEVTNVPGQGKVMLTGKLGDVMKESAQAAYSLIKSHATEFGVAESNFRKKDLHIHVPEGAVPKDGPSAGIAMATAIMSHLTGRPVAKDVAMTGEVTLRGRVLPIGGLKEKVLAALREGIKKVIFPDGNKKDLPEIPDIVKKSIELIAVKSIYEVFNIALGPVPLKSGLPSTQKPIVVPQPN